MKKLEYFFILLALICIYLSYLFTLVESAYFSLTSSKIENIKEHSHENLKYFEINIKNLDDIFSLCLFGDFFFNMLCAVSISILLFDKLHFLGLFLGTIFSAILIVVFGQVLPKSNGAKKSEKISLKYAKTFYFLKFIFFPFTFFTTVLGNLCLKITGKDKNYREPLITEDELKDAVNIGFKEGILDREELGFIENVIGFSDADAKDIMTPRTDIVALEINDSYEDIIKTIQDEGFSRIPVYEEELDNIIGIFHVKDISKFRGAKSLCDFKKFLRPAYYTFEYKDVSQLFKEMRSSKISLAIVTNEYGGTEGLITMEDLIEKIVGSISDEYDQEDDEEIVKISNDEYLIDGAVNISEVNSLFNKNFESNEYDSIAGYLIEKIDRFPKVSEKFMIDDVLFVVKETSKNRIDKLLLKKIK